MPEVTDEIGALECRIFSPEYPIGLQHPRGHYYGLDFSHAGIVAVDCYRGPDGYDDAVPGMRPFAVSPLLVEPPETDMPSATARFMLILLLPRQVSHTLAVREAREEFNRIKHAYPLLEPLAWWSEAGGV